MQDNRSQKEKDVAFENKAWMDMRKLLDKEMPVQKKKDRAFFWWWGNAVALLLLVTVGSVFIFLNSKELETVNGENIIVKEQSSIIPKDEQVVPSEKCIAKSITTEEQKEVSIGKTTIRSKETKSLKIIEHNDTPNNTQINIETTNTEQQGTAHSSALDNRIYPNVIIDTTVVHLQRSTITPQKALGEIIHSSLGSPTFNKEEKVMLIEKKELLVILNIPSLEVMNLPTVSYKPTFPVQAIPKKKRMDWALVASLGTFKLTRFNEYAIGLKTTYQLQEKWRVGTGLNYHYFRLNGLVKADNDVNTFSLPQSEVDISMDNMDAAADTAGAGTSTSEQEGSGSLPIPTVEESFIDPLALSGKVYYLSIPLFMEYKVSPNLKMDIGAAYYYRLASTFGDSEERLNQRDWTNFVGIAYEFSPHVNLRISYERNWSKKRSGLLDKLESNANNFTEVYSPLEGRVKLSGVWQF